MKKIHNVKKILGTTGMAASAITSIVASTSCKDLFVVHPGIGIDISKISSNDEGLQVTVPVKNIKNVDELDLLEINNSKVVIDYVINFLTIYANNKITTNDFVISNSAYTGDKTNGSEMVVGYIGATKNSKIIFGETHFNFLVNYVQKSNDLSVLTNGNSNITINVKTDNVTNVTQQEINEINKNWEVIEYVLQRIRTIDTTVVIEDVKISNSLSPNNYYASNDKIETVITVSSMPSINKFINSFKTVVSILFSEPSKDISSLSGELDHMETPIIIQAKDPWHVPSDVVSNALCIDNLTLKNIIIQNFVDKLNAHFVEINDFSIELINCVEDLHYKSWATIRIHHSTNANSHITGTADVECSVIAVPKKIDLRQFRFNVEKDVYQYRCTSPYNTPNNLSQDDVDYMLLNNYTVDGASFNSDISNQIKEVSPTATAGVDYEIKFAIDRNFDFSAPSIITYSINSIINSQLFSYSTIDLEFSVQFIPYEYTLAYNGNKHICYADDDPFSGVVYNDCGGYLDSSIGNAGWTIKTSNGIDEDYHNYEEANVKVSYSSNSVVISPNEAGNPLSWPTWASKFDPEFNSQYFDIIVCANWCSGETKEQTVRIYEQSYWATSDNATFKFNSATSFADVNTPFIFAMHYHSIAPTSNISVTFSPDASGSTARKSNGDIDEELTTKLTTRAITFNGSTTPSSYTNACWLQINSSALSPSFFENHNGSYFDVKLTYTTTTSVTCQTQIRCSINYDVP